MVSLNKKNIIKYSLLYRALLLVYFIYHNVIMLYAYGLNLYTALPVV